MAFDETIANEVLVACRRSCCICHRFRGTKIEIHHIVHKSEGGKDVLSNAIPLCFDCHGDQTSYDHKHPKGRKYTRQELTEHRDNWYRRVAGSPMPDYGDGAKSADKSLYDEITTLLPLNGVIRVVRQHIFASPFKRDWFEPLFVFQDRLSDPAFEFIDADMESLRADLAKAIQTFLLCMQQNTFYVEDNMEYSSAPKEWKSFQRDTFYKAVDDLQKESNTIGAAFDAFVKAGRRRLL